MFEHNYLVFDEFGPKQILCMACGSPIKSRSEMKSLKDSSLVMRELAKHPEYKEVPVTCDDGAIIFIMVCDSCKFVDIGEKEADLITKQINLALKHQLEHEGKTEEIIDAILNSITRKVMRKSEVHEVTAAMKGV